MVYTDEPHLQELGRNGEIVFDGVSKRTSITGTEAETAK